MSELKPCPQCKSTDISLYRFTQYRPKEGMVKCESCGFFVPVKGCYERVLIREWNKAATKGSADEAG
jgi:uncharacterized Zn finger protein